MKDSVAEDLKSWSKTQSAIRSYRGNFHPFQERGGHRKRDNLSKDCFLPDMEQIGGVIPGTEIESVFSVGIGKVEWSRDRSLMLSPHWDSNGFQIRDHDTVLWFCTEPTMDRDLFGHNPCNTVIQLAWNEQSSVQKQNQIQMKVDLLIGASPKCGKK